MNMKRKSLDEEEEKETWELLDKKPSQVDDIIEMTILENNHIVLHGELNEETCNKVCKKLLYLHFHKVENVDVILNTVGGEVYHGLLIFNMMEALKQKGMKISITVHGLCASMGLIILLGGTHRYTKEYSRFLLHETASWTYGKVSEMKEGVKETEEVEKMLNEIITERTKLSVNTLKKNTKKRDWWISSKEALQLGLVEKIV